ncbi:MAG: hypothetical protein AAEJ04_09635 [Planctomycetota bacterium]
MKHPDLRSRFLPKTAAYTLSRTLPLLLLVLCLCPGCGIAQKKALVTNIADYSREKDIKTYVITIDAEMKETAYQDWSWKHIESENLELENPQYDGIPIYEIHYHFVIRKNGYRPKRVAFLIWRRSKENDEILEHIFTYIGSRVPMQNWILR